MKEELIQPYSLFQCFSTGFRIYRTHLIPILILFLLLLLPAFITNLIGLGIEHILLFITMRLAEAAMALGVLSLVFQPIFPAISIFKTARPQLVFGAIHIAVLQFVIFLMGSLFVVLQFPLNIILLIILMFSLFAFAFAQIIFVVEKEQGFRALIASVRLVQTNMAKTVATVLLLGFLKFGLFTLLFFIFLPNIDFSEGFEDMQQMLQALQSQEVLHALRWSQYLGYVLLYPFAAIVLVLLYIDLKLTHSVLEKSALQQVVAPLLAKDSTLPEESKNSTESP